MTIQDLSLQDLVVFSNKYLSYLQILEDSGNKLAQISNSKTILFDFTSRNELFKKKYNEAVSIFNEIQKEIENRIGKKTGFDFESELLGKTIDEINNVFFNMQQNQNQ